MMIECAGFKKCSCDDGPGVRSVLFFQGCSMNCAGCHNKAAQKKGDGEKYVVEDLIQNVIMKACRNKKITISGGDPLEQQEGLLELVRKLKEKKFNICVYTGRDFSAVPQKILAYIDYLKVGSFVESKKSTRLHFVGLSNQKMLKKVNEEWIPVDLETGG